MVVVQHEQAHADDQKKRELDEDYHPAREQRRPALALILGREQALDQKLFGAVAGGGEEASADDPGPKTVSSREEFRGRAEPEIEHLELAKAVPPLQ